MARYCEKCGKEIEDNMTLCPECEKKQIDNQNIEETLDDIKDTVVNENTNEDPKKKRKSKTVKTKMATGKRISENMVYCEDGVYRWVYEYNLFKRFSIFFLIWRIFFFIIMGMSVFAFIVNLTNKKGFFGALLETLKVDAIAIGGMTVLVILGYLLYAAIMGGKYCVLFEMSENEIKHIQAPHQVKKAKIIADLTILAGLISGRPSVVGMGMTSSRKTQSTSNFDRVGKVKCLSRSSTIKLREGLEANEIYCAKEDYDFIKNYILERCHKAKIINRED